jgi:hypothetical protein
MEGSHLGTGLKIKPFGQEKQKVLTLLYLQQPKAFLSPLVKESNFLEDQCGPRKLALT